MQTCCDVQFPGALVIGEAAAGQTAEGLGTLQIGGIQQVSSFAALLEAMYPPAAPPLRVLELEGQLDMPPVAEAIPAGSAAARQLAQLCQLCLRSDEGSGSVLPLLKALLAHAAPTLTHLVVGGGLGAELPRCVAELRALRRLALPNNQLADLPAGPYLAGELEWAAREEPAGFVLPLLARWAAPPR